MRPSLRPAALLSSAPALRRGAATSAAKKEGDISDAFASLSGLGDVPLPDRYRSLKQDLVRGREAEVQAAWAQLLDDLRRENAEVRRRKSGVIPEVPFSNLREGIEEVKDEVRKRGVVVVRGVIPREEARGYKSQLEDYVRQNPQTRAFPADNPQVFELYWSRPQLLARAHPSLLATSKTLISSLWSMPAAAASSAKISTSHPLTYADRLRIRQPGDATFALGPHIDGGSVERWQPDGYGLSATYDALFAGDLAGYDPWDASRRVDVRSNLHDGLGACSMFRMWQGWLSMSRAAAGEGTLLVNPLLKLSTAYLMLRPFFRARKPRDAFPAAAGAAFLDGSNWEFTGGDKMDSALQGASPGHGQELNDALHPHLELDDTMVHVPDIQPGDFVAWHCDTIHAVDKVHAGTSDSSVLYIPICPVTDINAQYMVRQREAFLTGTPGPDFPGGIGESQHVGRPGPDILGTEGRRAMGLERLVAEEEASEGERAAVESHNRILGL